ncbi:hypothetical protein [Paracoccus pantotrophus]|uniref:hypothetical protein n=1 Tax=Paracoccus pantotrophus TaxID=82367 RepID=UPI0035B3016B
MSPAALRLDSFSLGAAGAGGLAPAAEREEAFQCGYEKGLAEGREASLDALNQALADLRCDMRIGQEKEVALRAELRKALAPVLHALVDVLGPRSQRERLRLALADEVARIVEHAPDRALVVRCPQDLQPDLADCLGRGQFPQVRIENLPPGREMVELVAGQGTILFDPAAACAELKAIIDDIKTGD